MQHTALWSCTHITNKYYLKNNYLILRSKVKVPLYGQAPTTKYHWPISKDNNVMARTRKYNLKNYFWPWGQMSRSHEGQYGTRHSTLWSCTHIPNMIDLSRKIKMLWSKQENTIWKTIIWFWGQSSRSHEGHYGMRHTALWSYTHIPNIIDLSGKTNKLWSGQASPRRRSGRKNQTKTICLPSFEGET